MCSQYFLICNLTKREFLHPHKLGMGLTLLDICTNKRIGVIPYLLRKSDGLGSGDIKDLIHSPNAGRWAGDRIVVIGDYDSSKLYNDLRDDTKVMNEQIPYKDISLEVQEEFEKFLGG